MTHEHLVRIGAKWLRKKTEGNIIVPNCNLVVTEMKVANKSGEIADIIGWCSFASIMIEVKVSRADFLQDSKKIFRKENCLGVGDFRYFLCPEGVIKEEDLNKGWGLLYCTDNKVRIVRKADKQEPNLLSERTLLTSIIRRNKLEKPIKV